MTNVFIISAPSGSGKSTLVEKVRQIVPGLDFSVSYTTRGPRGDEQHGREYFFVSREDFQRMVEAGEFLEHAEVFGNFYGTARHFLRDAEQREHDLLLDIDVQGAELVKQQLPEAIRIFILPPDREKLEWRLRHRGLDKEETIQRRLLTASREIENYSKYDYILVNDRLEDSIETLKAVLLAERLKRSGASRSAHDATMMARANSCRLNNAREHVQPILDSFRGGAGVCGR